MNEKHVLQADNRFWFSLFVKSKSEVPENSFLSIIRDWVTIQILWQINIDNLIVQLEFNDQSRANYFDIKMETLRALTGRLEANVFAANFDPLNL